MREEKEDTPVESVPLTKGEAEALRTIDRSGSINGVNDGMRRRIRRYVSRGWDRWRLTAAGLVALRTFDESNR